MNCAAYIRLAGFTMNIIGFFNDLFNPKPKASAKPTSKKGETSREAAARALDKIFHRNGMKR